MNQKNTEKKSLGDMLKHPLANVVIGFLLTGVLGTALTQYFIGQREKQARQSELAATRKESIANLSALNAEYIARAEMLLAAVERGDLASAEDLKAMFDDASVRWKTESNPTLMAARDVLPSEVYMQFRDRVSEEFHDRFLSPIGTCLNDAKEKVAQGDDVATLLASCRVREYLEQASDCSEALLDMLYDLSGYTVGGQIEDALELNREKYRDAVAEACAIVE